MRNIFTFLIACVFVLGSAPALLAADDPSEQFLDAYMVVQQAEKLEQSGKLRAALSKYKSAANTLDQIHDKAPTWQPVIVDYRKKKTADSILALEQKLATEAPATAGGNEGPLPTGIEPALPTREPGVTTSASLGDLVANATREIQRQIEKVQRDLRDAKSELQSARREKEELAEKLDNTLKQLSQTRINEAEIKARLSQAQGALAEVQSGTAKDSAGKKAIEVEVKRLKEALRSAQIDRDAAEEQALMFNNRVATLKNTATATAKKEVENQITEANRKVETIAKERDTAVKERDDTRKQNEQLTAKLGDAQQQITVLTRDRDDSRRIARDLETKLSATSEQIEAYQSERDTATTKANDLTNRLGDMQQQLIALASQRDEGAKDNGKLTAQLAESQKQVAEMTADRDNARKLSQEAGRKFTESQKQVTLLEKQRVDSEKENDKLTAKLTDAEKKAAAITADRDNARKAGQEATQKFAEAQKQVALLGKQRDDSEKENDKLTAKLTDAEKKVAAVTQDRNTIASQRDEALAQVAKMKDAQKRVDQLLADNSMLTQKLGTAEQAIREFSAEMPKKDEQIAMLKKDVGMVKDQLESARLQNKDFQVSIADLQSQLDSSGSELQQMKAEGGNPGERKRISEENDLLRNIVLRELKETAKRAQAKKLVMSELQKQEVQSNVLLEQIEYLTQPVVKLSDQEKALFKQPQIAISDIDEAAVFATAAPKKEPVEPAATPKPAKAAATPAAPQATPAPAPAATPAMAKATPNPVEMAKLTTPALAKATPTPAPKPDNSDLPTKNMPKDGTPPSDTTPKVQDNGFTPVVPDELLPLAREAKDFFDRNNYREAEKSYEKMLSKAPSNVYILSNLGVVRFRSGKLKLAEEAFKKAIAIAPNDAFSHCTLGIVYYSQGRDDDAINELTKSLAINPKNATAHNYLAITAARKGWQEAALKEEETAIALDQNYADAHFNLAVIHATAQPPNKEMARKHYQLAVKLGAEPDAALEQLIK